MSSFDTNIVGGLPPSTAPVPAPSQGAANLTSDFDTFLRMLTVQLQNQDPLNPVEATDYAVQLATFSGVEQQVQTNEILQTLAAEQSAFGLSQMASWVGKEALVTADGHWNGSPLSLVPETLPDATRAVLQVRDQSGAVVQRLDIPLNEDQLTWAGVDGEGNPFPNGRYRFDVISYDGDLSLGETQAQVYSEVNEVRIVDGATSLILAGDIVVPASAATALRN